MNYLIIGAGLSGMVLAERIASQRNEKVLLVDRRDHIGGNCYDEKNEANILIHKYGPHLFHTDNKAVVDYLSAFTEWEVYNHKVLAYIDGREVPIPFNFNTLYKVFPPELAQKLEQKLLAAYPYNSKVPILELKQSADEDLQFLADYIYEKIFVNYTAKQWGMKPEEIDGAVTARVPVFVGRDDRYFNDTYQMLPKQGYTAMFRNMLDHPNIKLMLNTDFKEICELKDGKFYLFGQPFDGQVIYTGQIDELFAYQFGELPYRSVRMEFETLSRRWYQDAATVNYPNQYAFTRITEFKHIHPIDRDRTTILKEYPEPYVIGKNTPYYPVFTDENQRKYAQYKDLAAQIPNLTLVGRLAEYRYFDMDDAIENALHVYQNKFEG
ncbi:UDP-galactopyranose mutase [Nitratifractor sp.]